MNPSSDTGRAGVARNREDGCWVPLEAALAFVEGDEMQARILLARARDAHPPGSLDWARLERLYGLVSIHLLREVEGTFALERADAALSQLGMSLPDLDVLGQRAQGAVK